MNLKQIVPLAAADREKEQARICTAATWRRRRLSVEEKKTVWGLMVPEDIYML